MKTTLSSNLAKSFVGISLVLLAGLAACGKKQPAVSPPAEISGVKVDMPKLQAAFVGAPQELQTDVNQTASSLRYGQYEKALDPLHKALVLNPQGVSAHHMLGKTLFMRGEFAGAATELEVASSKIDGADAATPWFVCFSFD